MNLIGSICLTDIPKDLIKIGKDGKKYLTIYIGQRRQVSQFGHSHFIKAYVPRDKREEGVEHFIGDAKPSEYQTQQTRIMKGAETLKREQKSQQVNRQSFTSENDDGDLPF